MLADSFGSLMYESTHPCFSDIMCHCPNLETAKVLEFFFLCESENYPRSGCYTVSDVSFSCRDYQFSITIRIKNDRLVHDDPDKTKVGIKKSWSSESRLWICICCIFELYFLFEQVWLTAQLTGGTTLWSKPQNFLSSVCFQRTCVGGRYKNNRHKNNKNPLGWPSHE